MKKCALQQNAIILSKEIEKSSKLEVMKNETYGEKSYITEMNMHNAQINLLIVHCLLKLNAVMNSSCGNLGPSSPFLHFVDIVTLPPYRQEGYFSAVVS